MVNISWELSVNGIYKSAGWGTRHTLAFMGFWGLVASYAMRVNLSIAIVDMVSTNGAQGLASSQNRTGTTDACPSLRAGAGESHSQESAHSGDFDWDSEEQGVILGAFFWGYFVLQIPGGMLAERIGGKWPFGIGMLVTAVFSLLTPAAARAGKGYLVAVRIIQGLGEGVTYPAMHVLLSKWLPPLERSKLGSVVYAGAQIGTVLGMLLCGYLISSGILGGWPSVFYVMGVGGIIWFIFWSVLVFDSPARHPRIGLLELEYIQSSIGLQGSAETVPTPWRSILTSMPVMAILVAQTGHAWGLYTLITELPTYMNNVLHFELGSNSWLSAIPFFVMWLFALLSCWTADTVREKGIATTITVRKVCNTIAQTGAAVALIGAAYSGCDSVLSVTLVTISIGITGSVYASFMMNHIDIAPNHAGILMGFTNCIASIPGMFAPYVAGVILQDSGTLSDWRLIFIITATIMISDSLFYIIFSSGEEQEWNRPEVKEASKI